MKKWELRVLAWRMEWIWKQIQRNRKKMNRLIEKRLPYTNSRLVALDIRNRWLACQHQALDCEYRELDRIH